MISCRGAYFSPTINSDVINPQTSRKSLTKNRLHVTLCPIWKWYGRLPDINGDQSTRLDIDKWTLPGEIDAITPFVAALCFRLETLMLMKMNYCRSLCTVCVEYFSKKKLVCPIKKN